MPTSRLEAFSDGVIAILITIMVIEFHAPEEVTLDALRPLVPVLLSYVLSFVFLGIYWNNHHHLFQAAERVSGGVLWANLHLLFWLSLVPFVTSWMGEHEFARVPVAAYGVVLCGAALAYRILADRLVRVHDRGSALVRALGSDAKGWLSLAAYVLGIALTPIEARLSLAIYASVALWWLIPARRIEHALADASGPLPPGGGGLG